MPDLGAYAFAVLSAYCVALALILLLVAVSVLQSRKARAEMRAAEARLAAEDRSHG